MTQEEWLQAALVQASLNEEAEGYLLGRAAKPETIIQMGLKVWSVPVDMDPAPDRDFRARYGDRGEELTGKLICPLYVPRGDLIGFEARTMEVKEITRYLINPRSEWNPIWIGMQKAMPAIWAGRDIWIVEGQFDMYPLEWIVPEGDAILASIRAKLTYRHVEFLRRFGNFVRMVYDRDEAGRKGINGWTDPSGQRHWGALQSLQKVGVKCVDVPYSGAKDPGELWDRGGHEALRRAFKM